MDERKKLILDIIIKDYISSGQPVASSVMVEEHDLPFSSATVRNEMAELEADGWIAQPYTSAGRIPTEKAYRLYISAFADKPPLLSKREEAALDAVGSSDTEAKQTAKALAQLSNLAVIWAFHKYHVYYTGLSNLLQQPEFDRPHLVYDMSSIIDRVDEIVGDIFDETDFQPRISLGQSCPFGAFSGAVLSRFKTKDGIGLVGILGPMRMDYEKNLARLNFIINSLNNSQ